MTETRIRVLIVDDEERVRRLFMDFLEDYEEFSPGSCDSGEAALEELSREGADLCIVDMRLPGMDGQAFIVTAHDRGLCHHFLLHTGSTDFSLGKPLTSRGLTPQDVFLKPCDVSEILARIREIFHQPGA